ncbi:MAG TPA: recombinase family protein [Ktedonobacteraceae bacterium]|nr:recombinase family protein [Ktedonobacteraceae bacterium]
MSVRSIQRKRNSNTNPWPSAYDDLPKGKDGIIYVRQSTEYQRENNIHSFEMQTEKFIQHFRSMGYTGLIRIIADDEEGKTSGTLDIHKRPGLSQVTKIIEEEGGTRLGWIAAVHVNRLTRDPWLLTPAHLMKLCFEHDVWIITLRMPFNFKDEYCQQVFMLEAQESARHLKWMKLVLGGAKSAASDNGYYDGRFLVPGYIVDRTDPRRKKYIPYRPHAEIVFWLFNRFLELDGNFAVLRKEVDQMPYLFPKFEEWVDKKNISRFMIKEIEIGPYAGNYKPTENGLESILTNPVYLGWWIPLDGGVIENNHESIVDEGLFTYAHKRLSSFALDGARQKPERVVRNGKVKALLKKVLRNEDGVPFYALPDNGGAYKCLQNSGLVNDYKLSVKVEIIDPLFLGKFFEHLRSWKGYENWEERLEQMEKIKEHREQTILSLIAEAQRQRRETMSILDDPDVPKTKQMKIEYAMKIAGLEEKIQQLKNDLTPAVDEEEEDEKVQYTIYTLLPDLIAEWENLQFETQLRFIGALVRRVVMSHPAPLWIKVEIIWKRPEWGVDILHLRRRAYQASWAEEEDAIIREMYPRVDAADILQKLPDRTWEAIRQRGQKIAVVRERGVNMTDAYRVYDDVSLRDVQYAQEHTLTLKGKNPQWIR